MQPFGVRRWAERAERTGWPARLAATWCVCAAPRAALFLVTPPSADYRFFIDGEIGSYWYPLYTALAGFLWWAAQGVLPIFIAFHLAIDACLGPVVYLLAARLRFDPAQRWMSVVGVATLPYYVSVTARQPNVGVTVVGFALLVLLFAGWAEGGFRFRDGVWFAIAGFLFMHLRPNVLVTLAALYALAAMRVVRPTPRDAQRRVHGSRAIVASVLVLAALSTGMAAWNLWRSGHFGLFPPNNGYNLYVGNNPWLVEYARRHDIPSFEQVVYDRGLPFEATTGNDPYERDASLARWALRYAASHPRQTLVNWCLKAWRYWDIRLEDADLNPALWNAGYTIPYIACILLAGCGTWRLWARGARWSVALVLVALLSYGLPYLVYSPTIRMRMTSEFLLVMLAACGLAPSRVEVSPSLIDSPE